MNKKMFGALVVSAIAVGNIAPAFANSHKAEKMGKCVGVNSCKGQGACGGDGHECAGKNACKGQGWTKASQADCKKKNGKFEAEKG